jgi:hypothetical protein
MKEEFDTLHEAVLEMLKVKADELTEPPLLVEWNKRRNVV